MTLLLVTRIIAFAGIAIGLLGLALRMQAILQRPFKKDLSRPRGSSGKGILYAFTLGMAPWEKESTRKHWIAYNLKPVGAIVVDAGAHDALVQQKKSLLPSGVKEVRGSFGAGDCVRCLDVSQREFARGLVSYSAQELNRIKGLHTSNIEKVLGYKACDEIIHRDDLVLL